MQSCVEIQENLGFVFFVTNEEFHGGPVAAWLGRHFSIARVAHVVAEEDEREREFAGTLRIGGQLFSLERFF
jgi:hypothetical protein